VIAALLHIGTPSLEEPQAGVDGVVIRLVAGSGKDVG